MDAPNGSDDHADTREKAECFASPAVPSENEDGEDADGQGEDREELADQQTEARTRQDPRNKPKPPPTTDRVTVHE
jgi:hypothetical protein